MIVVGFGKARHDSSICVYRNGDILYSKYERECEIKHAYAPDWWFYQKLRDWDINFKEISLIVETNTGFKTPNGNHSNRLPTDGESYYISVDEQQIILDHHLAHSFSNVNYIFPNQTVVIDNFGSGRHTELVLDSDKIHKFKVTTPGMIYNTLGFYMGFTGSVLSHAGKIMGLTSYGKINKKLLDFFFKETCEFENLNPIVEYLKYYSLSGKPIDAKSLEWVNLLATLDEVCYGHIERLFSLTDKSKPIVYSGGCALNVNWNRRLLNSGYQLYVDPHVYDGGLSIGCMRFGLDFLGVKIPEIKNFPYIQDDEVPDTTPTDETINKVAKLLADGKIVGWYQGHGEIGPRALGNRSILMNPTIKDGKDILNQKVKHREWWRPFGASIKKDKAHEYFDLHDSPYMLYSSQVLKSGLDAITHIDGSCRHQTVTPEQNEIFYKLLDAFEEKSGLPVLLNTSLNLGGKPIAGTMAEAIELFQTTEMDALCLGNHLLLK